MKIALFTLSFCLSIVVYAQLNANLEELYKEQTQSFYQGQYEESLVYFDSIQQMEQNLNLTSLNMAFIAIENLLRKGVQPESLSDLDSMLYLLGQKIDSIIADEAWAGNGNRKASESETSTSNKDTQFGNLYTEVHTVPTFPGGLKKFYKYVSKNLKSSYLAQEFEGEVKVQFVVTKNGKIRNVEVVQGLQAACDAETIRIVSASPDWQPGLYNDQPVDVLVTLPIAYKSKINFWKMIEEMPQYTPIPPWPFMDFPVHTVPTSPYH